MPRAVPEVAPAPVTGAARDAVGSSRDGLLDAVKALAIARVVAWHTWAWWWLSWIAAMPAMFFVSGSLLDDSLERRSYVDVLRSRFRRLLIPFWLYAAVAVAIMIAAGWHASPRQLVTWVVPLADPVGSPETPGLWIPLWYLRAYLWFLLAAPLLRRFVDTLGGGAMVACAGGTIALWAAERRGWYVPLALSDAVGYSFFVVAGIVYHRRGGLGPRSASAVGVGCAVAAVAWCVTLGPQSRVVNEAYPLQLLAGCALLAFALAAAPALTRLGGRTGRVVRFVGARALTIYLWQGLGLLAADRVVNRQGVTGAAAAVAAIAVVVVVTAACVWAFGWVESWAAGRAPRPPRLRLAPLGAAATGCLVLAVVMSPAPQTTALLPPSGRAVIARGDLIEEQLGESAPRPAPTPVDDAPPSPPDDLGIRLQASLDDWAIRHADVLEQLDTNWISAMVIDLTGEPVELFWSRDGRRDERDLIPWWSISKVVTTAWLSELVDTGEVALDDPLSTYLPQIPWAGDITLEDLARHRSGLPSDIDAGVFDANPRVDLERWLEAPRLEFQPGAGFAYSRLGYFLLAWALEEASGRSWVDTTRDLAARAGVSLAIDEDLDPLPEPTHPGGGSYRGRLWSSGGILATRDDSVRFFRWLMTEGLTPGARANMTRFAPDRDSWYYGLALLPLCPCEIEGPWLRSMRYGLDALTATWAFDEATTATVFVTPDAWFEGDAPRPEFYELEGLLLDVAGGGGMHGTSP